jgi:Tfp pilus assembly protein PilV
VSRSTRGVTVVEALAAGALVGLAVAGLAASAALATRSLGLARDTSIAIALATAQLETLRAGARAAGSDIIVATNGTRFTRRWHVTGGRGEPVGLNVDVAWGERTLGLATEALP